MVFEVQPPMTDRGTYRALDRERHFIVGWGADQFTSYVQDRTIGAALRPVLPVVDGVARTGRAAQHWWVGSQMVGGRDEAEKPLAQVGQEFFHTVADRDRAIAMLSTHFKALANDLATWHLANKGAANATASVQWLDADVTPTLEEWHAFVAHEKLSWWTKAATSWETFEEWWNRLRQLRALARAHGILLQSSEPVSLPKTIWQRGASGKGTEATALLGVFKVGVFAALTITGAVSLFAIVRDLRPRKIT